MILKFAGRSVCEPGVLFSEKGPKPTPPLASKGMCGNLHDFPSSPESQQDSVLRQDEIICAGISTGSLRSNLYGANFSHQGKTIRCFGLHLRVWNHPRKVCLTFSFVLLCFPLKSIVNAGLCSGVPGRTTDENELWETGWWSLQTRGIWWERF